jgi:uncharacterized protein
MEENIKQNMASSQEVPCYSMEELLYHQVATNFSVSIQTIEELLKRDKQREEDGFNKKIKLGKFIKPSKDGKDDFVVVPTTVESKFYHDESEDEQGSLGGVSKEGEGTGVGEKKDSHEQEKGSGEGPGNSNQQGHDLNSNAYHLGKILTDYFDLPNLKKKGQKKSLSDYKYELTDINRGFGQLIDKKQTLRQVVKSNILLGNIKPYAATDLTKLLHIPSDTVYKILSKEVSYETEALVFFIRDYSGSMKGSASEAVLTQHLFLYSWLVFQYDSRVTARFILHDTEAKEVEDFDTYYRSSVAGGTRIHPAFSLANSIISNEQLHLTKNIYVFYGSDGDDWLDSQKLLPQELKKLAQYTNRIGLFVARNSGSGNPTSLENTIKDEGVVHDLKGTLVMEHINAREYSETEIVESIKKILAE